MTHLLKYHWFSNQFVWRWLFKIIDFHLSGFGKWGFYISFTRVRQLTHWSIHEIPQNAWKNVTQTVFENLCAISFVSLYNIAICSFFNESIRIHASVGRPYITRGSTRPRPHNRRLLSSTSRPCRALTSSLFCPKFEMNLVLVPSWRRPRMRTVSGRLVPFYGSLFGSWNAVLCPYCKCDC